MIAEKEVVLTYLLQLLRERGILNPSTCSTLKTVYPFMNGISRSTSARTICQIFSGRRLLQVLHDGSGDPHTKRLYDRRQQKVTRNIVERITI